MLLLVTLTLLAAANGLTIEKRGMQTMDTISLQAFTRMFRETLLNKIALEMNNTVDMTSALKVKMDHCKPMIDAQMAKCKADAQSTCQKDPTLTDYLNLANPYTYLKEPMNDMAGKLGDAVDLVGDGAAGFVNSMKDLGESATGSVYSGFSSAFNGLQSGLDAVGGSFVDAGNGVIDTAGLIGDGLTNLGHGLTDGFTDAGHAIEHLGSDIGSAIGSIFGRKRREMDAETRACMERCPSCKSLLLPQQKLITAVCGADIVNTNNTIQAKVQKLKMVYDYALDKTNTIVKQLQFDPSSMNGQMQLTNVRITVHLNGHDETYKTQVPYSMMNMPATVKMMAMEYWGKA